MFIIERRRGERATGTERRQTEGDGREWLRERERDRKRERERGGGIERERREERGRGWSARARERERERESVNNYMTNALTSTRITCLGFSNMAYWFAGHVGRGSVIGQVAKYSYVVPFS